MELYIDESGDLGFSQRSSDYFILAAIVARDTLSIQRCVKNVRRGHLPKKYKKTSELKFNKSDNNIKNRVLKGMSNTPNDIAYAVLRKYQVYDRLRNKPQTIYNYICGNLIDKIIREYDLKGSLDIFVDKSLNGIQRENFDKYLECRTNIRVNVDHVNSREYQCIQAADFVAGAIYRKYNYDDNRYYQKFESRVSLALDFFENRNKDYVVNPSLLRPTRQ